MRRSRGLTLIELLLAVGLLTLVVMGFTTMDFFSIQQLNDADRRVKMQNELAFILDDMQKNIFRATSISVPSSTRLEVTVDNNNPSSVTPDNITDDVTIIYELDSANFRVNKTITISGVSTTEAMNNLAIMVPGSGMSCASTGSSSVRVILTARKVPTAAGPTFTNPQVELSASMSSHSLSIH